MDFFFILNKFLTDPRGDTVKSQLTVHCSKMTSPSAAIFVGVALLTPFFIDVFTQNLKVSNANH